MRVQTQNMFDSPESDQSPTVLAGTGDTNAS